MKKTFLIILLTSFMSVLIGAGLYPNNKQSQKAKTAEHQEFTILENGVKRKIKISTSGKATGKMQTYSSDKLNAKSGLIISFINPNAVSMSNFTARYNLELKHKLQSGYFIFANNSKQTDLELVRDIIANEDNVKTVKPNWPMRNVPY